MTERGKMNREGDVVLIYYQDKPMAYARIETIRSDSKKDWYQVTLLFLTIPSHVVTWILRQEYINGDVFTMGGQTVRLERVERISANDEPKEESESSGSKGMEKPAKVIPFKKQP